MLIKNYIKSVMKCPNHTDFLVGSNNNGNNDNGDIESMPQYPTISHYGIRIRTGALSDFPSVTPQELTNLYEDQLQAVKKELKLYLEYNYITKSSANTTTKQYDDLYFYEGIAYHKGDLRDYIVREYNLSSVFTQDTTPVTETEKLRKKISNDDTQHISIDAIRSITGFSTDPYLPHKKKVVDVKWQKEFLLYASDSQNREITINGSRQIGKSKTLAQLLVEYSFIPNYDQAVVAPTQGHTSLIKNYIEKYIDPFHGTDFDFHIQSRDNVITNKFSGSKIYFKTLDKEGQAALGLTLKRVVVDEAQLVSVDTVMDSLKPTLLTTEGQLILLGTAIEKTSSYMYQSIVSAKRGDDDVKVITVSLDQNPFVSDSDRTRIQKDRANPYKTASIERQYYNQWGKNGDSVLNPTTFQFEQYHTQAPLIIGIDPARKHDRSAYSICEARDGKIYTLTSGEVPIAYKSDWTLQAKFLKDMIADFDHRTKHIVIDGTGVGDGVVDIFRANGIKITHIVQYTAGVSESHDGDRSRVGKSLMLNRMVDSFQEQRLRIEANMNKLLLDEVEDLTVEQNNFGNLVLKGEGYDDIFNATMIANYYIIKLQLHTKYSSETQASDSYSFKDEMNIYKHKTKTNYTNQPSGW